MARSRFSWAASVFTPWWLGLAFAVSMTADAGQDATFGVSVSPLSTRAAPPPEILVPPSASAMMTGDLGRLTGEASRLFRRASLVLEGIDNVKRLSDEIEPRTALEPRTGPAPSIDRKGRGDPVVGVRPTFDITLRGNQGLARLRASAALFVLDERSPVAAFSEPEGELSLTEPLSAFEPWPEDESPTTLPVSTETSPQRPGSATTTWRPAAVNERLMQGATPLLRRAEALGSTTPARADSMPVEVVAHATLPPSLSAPADPAGRVRVPRADLYGRESTDRERRCLAEAIYFEARGESEQGQAAVAQVVLNRVASGLYPATICGVVYQNRHRFRACQFSFACDGRSLRVSEPSAWRTAVRIAGEVTNGRIYVSDVGSSTHYHADYVLPRWAGRLERMDVIGHHIFYKLRPGQN